jgi:hypothetical protein
MDYQRLMHKDIQLYDTIQASMDNAICNLPAQEICLQRPDAENKIGHVHSVCFLDGNLIAGYSKFPSLFPSLN